MGLMADVPEIVALEMRSQGAPHWGEVLYRGMLERDGGERVRRVLLVAEVRGGVAGFAVASALGSPAAVDRVELESVVVAEEVRRRGVGRALCEAVIRWADALGADEVELEVRAASEARQLYAGLGFVVVGRRRGYYRNPEEDAVLMRLELG